MQEKFSVVLEAVTSQFKAKMEEVKNLGQQAVDRIKQNFQNNKVSIDVDTSKVVKIAELKREISTLKSEMKDIDPGTGLFKEYAVAIDEAEKELKQLNTQQKEVKKSSNSLKGIGNNVKSIGNSFQKAVGKVKKFALALLSVRTVFSAVSRASQAYLSFDQDLADRLQSAWAGLGAQLAPIIEYLVNLFAKAVGYVNAFVKALTGINMVARANAKALNNQSKSAKSASKSLTSLDEITNIDDDAGGSGGDIPQIKLPEVDTSGLENALKRIKELASTLFEPIKKAWDKYGGQVIKSAKNMVSQLWGLIKEVGKSFAEVWTNGTGEKAVGWILQIFRDIFDIIGGIAEALKNAWSENETGTKIIQAIADYYNAILEFVESITNSLKKWVLSESFQNALKAVLKIVKDLVGRASDIANWIVDMYTKYLAPVVDEVLGLLTDVIDLIGAIWDTFSPAIDKIWNVIKQILEPAIASVGNEIQLVIGIIRGLVQIVTGVLKGDWDKVWNGMKKIAVSVINTIIRSINVLIRGLNKVKLKAPDWLPGVGGKEVGFNIKEIKQLDTGTGYVPEDQLAYIHKGEAVIPKKFNSAEYFSNINDNTETNNLLIEVNRTLIDILEKDNSFYVNGKELARTTYNDFQEEGNRINKNNIVKVG